jgi:hypothetical protein
VSIGAVAGPSTLIERVIDRLEGYLFRPGGRYGIAIARIGLFVGIYITFTKLPFSAGRVESWYVSVSQAAYRPKGLVLLFWSAPPPVSLVEALIIVAQVSTIMAIIGILTRPAMVTSVLSVLFLRSLGYSFVYGWSHPHNVMLLVGLIFMFGRAGDHLSADAVIRRWRAASLPPNPVIDGSYMWPLLLGQAAAALFYFGAFFAKIVRPDYSLNVGWVLSDSLRNMLIQPWFVAGQPLPWYVELTASHCWLWQFVAFGHLLTQFTPIFACFAINRPWLRLAEGLIFGAGVYLLGWFMSYWNHQWLLLLPFFVDWDYYGARLQRYLRALSCRSTLLSHCAERPLIERDFLIIGTGPWSTARGRALGRRIVLIWASVFFVIYVGTFMFRLGFIHLLYPFSNFDFFSDVHALEPYSEHRHWYQHLGQVSLVTDKGETFVQPFKDWLISRYRGNDKLRIDSSLEQKRGLVLAAANQELQYDEWKLLWKEERLRASKKNIKQIRYWGATVHFPAYPAPPGWTTVFRGLVGAYELATETIRIVHGTLVPKGRTGEFEKLDLIFGGFEKPHVSLFFAPDPRMTPGQAELVEVAGHFEFEQNSGERGDSTGRFVIQPGQSLPWRAATLIEVREQGSPQIWQFVGPVVMW